VVLDLANRRAVPVLVISSPRRSPHREPAFSSDLPVAPKPKARIPWCRGFLVPRGERIRPVALSGRVSMLPVLERG
jgi:hypothetical protein